MSGGVLWPDPVNKLFYLFGGEFIDTAEVNRRQTLRFDLWYYDIIYDKWNKTQYHGSQASVKWPALGAGAVSDGGIAYWYGGYLTNKSDINTAGQPIMQSALISFEMDSRKWANESTDQPPRAEGSLLWLPASERGMLVYFGGVEMNVSTGAVTYVRMFPFISPLKKY